MARKGGGGALDPWAAYERAGRAPAKSLSNKRVGSKSGVVVKRGAGGRIMGSVKRIYDPGVSQKPAGLSYARVHTALGKNRQKQQVTVRGMDYNPQLRRPKERTVKVSRGEAARILIKARAGGNKVGRIQFTG